MCGFALDLFDVDLVGSELYGAVLADVRINDATAFGLLYPFVGGVTDGGVIYRLTSPAELASVEGLETVARGLYFSVITFTTIGYANVAPAGGGSRVLVGIESLAGALLMALFVYVLARRVTR